jgi:hypothetical protein
MTDYGGIIVCPTCNLRAFCEGRAPRTYLNETVIEHIRHYHTDPIALRLEHRYLERRATLILGRIDDLDFTLGPDKELR